MYVYRGRVNAGGQEKGVDRTSVWSWTWCEPPATRIRSRHHREPGLGLRACGAPGERDRPSAGPEARLRVLFPGRSWEPFTERSSGNNLGSDRPGDLRRLPRFEGLPSEEAVSDLPLRQATTLI